MRPVTKRKFAADTPSSIPTHIVGPKMVFVSLIRRTKTLLYEIIIRNEVVKKLYRNGTV